MNDGEHVSGTELGTANDSTESVAVSDGVPPPEPKVTTLDSETPKATVNTSGSSTANQVGNDADSAEIEHTTITVNTNSNNPPSEEAAQQSMAETQLQADNNVVQGTNNSPNDSLPSQGIE